MYPQTFLKTFWQMEVLPQVFVAMSFAPQYHARFRDVIEPAVNALSINGAPLSALRVDLSKSGDSILTDISKGVAHSQLVLADVSTIGKDSVSGRPYRNANVLYEVGLALACRQSSEVLLVRDDHDDFLFDVSTVPHKTIDFTNTEAARKILTDALMGRLREQNFVRDARIRCAINSLSGEELCLMKQIDENMAQTAWGRSVKSLANWYSDATQRLLDKQLVYLVGEFDGVDNQTAFAFTPMGRIVHKAVNSGLRKFPSRAIDSASPKDDDLAARREGQPLTGGADD